MRKVILVGIILLAFILRVPLLEKIPTGFTPDEASFGYDAYSILRTSRDQWGHTLPLVLESFGDFKAPLYSYLDIPFIALIGLNKVATRLPNALLGVNAVIIVYFLIQELFADSKKDSFFATHSISLALIAAFMLAISPWHVMLSRGAFEANLTVFFLPLAVLFYFKSFKTPKFLIWSSLFFGLNVFTYHSPKVVTPLLLIVLIVLYFKKLVKVEKKILFTSILVLAVFVILSLYTFTIGAGRRAADVGIFNGALEAQAQMRLNAINTGMSPVLARFVYNKYFTAFIRFSYIYKQYLSPEFLFTNGGGETTYGMLPGIGVLYRFEIFTLISFLILFWKKRYEKALWFIFFWILIAPIPAGLTMGVGYAGNRAAGMMPALQIASGLGLFYFLYILYSGSGFKKRFSCTFALILITLISLLSFVKVYFTKSAQVAAKGMLYGDLEVAYWLKDNSSDTLRIVVSRRLSEPQIYIAFANIWDPNNYQNQTTDWNRYKDEKLVFLDQLHRYYLGKYVFQNISSPDLQIGSQVLLVGRPEEFPDDSQIIKKFVFPDGSPSLYVVRPSGDSYAQAN